MLAGSASLAAFTSSAARWTRQHTDDYASAIEARRDDIVAAAITARTNGGANYSVILTPATGNYLTTDNHNVAPRNIGFAKVHAANITAAGGAVSKRSARLDTVFCRDLIFITSLYRVVRLHLSQQLTYSKEVIRAASSITDWKLTEFEGFETLQKPRDEDKLVGNW
jgi:hypothetical protein